MKLPNSFIPKKNLEKEMRRLQNQNKKTVKSASDLILEDRLPCGYVLDSKSEFPNFEIRSMYSFQIPLDDLQSALKMFYKYPNTEGSSLDIRVDIFEFKEESFVSKNIEKFYNVKQRLNSRANSSVGYKMLIKKKYVAFFRAPYSCEDVLEKFIHEYKTRFEMKEVCFTLK